MKSILSLCVVCLIAVMVGCESDDSTASMAVSPGAVGEAETCTATCDKSEASMGAVSESTCSEAAKTCTKTDG